MLAEDDQNERHWPKLKFYKKLAYKLFWRKKLCWRKKYFGVNK